MDGDEKAATKRPAARAVLLFAAASAAVLASSGVAGGAAQGVEHAVGVTPNEFTPENLTVAAGDTVR